MKLLERLKQLVGSTPRTDGIRILLTNDDGIHAPGLETLEHIARALTDDVWIVAPESEQSGASHSLTLHNPLRIRELGPRRYAVNGTPTDCILLGAKTIIKAKDKPIDLVLSGVNRGSNLGEDISYSGTVAGAKEGTLLGIPSIALSQSYTDMKPIRWDTAEKFAPALIRRLTAIGWPHNNLININFPDVPPEHVKGIRMAPQGQRQLGDRLTERTDPKSRPYYWIGTERDDDTGRPGSDIAMAAEGHITVTPLCMDMTNYEALEKIREQFEEPATT